MEPFLKLERIGKSYPSGQKQIHVLRDFDLELAAGEFLAVIGDSGSGKTTLLNLIAGLDHADSGRITMGGRDLTGISDSEWIAIRQRQIGFIFQFNQLLPEFTALENVMLPGLLLPGAERADLEERASNLLTRMGLRDRLHHEPARLSGGEQQRTAVARALINRPGLILADEPTGNLDRRSGGEVVSLLFELQREFGIACIMVTHNPELADLCDRILAISKAAS